jgi:enoyl-CoA hydratase/carnithine racemase
MATLPVTSTVTDETATLTLDRPSQANPLNRETAKSLQERLSEIRGGDARCVVIEGAGETFSAGGDISTMNEWLEDDSQSLDQLDSIEAVSQAVVDLVRFPLPTIAKIDGAAVGAGASLAIACDLQVATRRSKLGFVFRNVGLTVDSATSYLLARQVGANVAKELVFTGELIEAERAQELGLLNAVHPADEFEERVEALADRIASGPTAALRQSKRLIDQARTQSLTEARANEDVAQSLLLETDDFEEGVRAFLDSREPEFEGK